MFGTYIYLSIYLHDIVSISVSYIYIYVYIFEDIWYFPDIYNIVFTYIYIHLYYSPYMFNICSVHLFARRSDSVIVEGEVRMGGQALKFVSAGSKQCGGEVTWDSQNLWKRTNEIDQNWWINIQRYQLWLWLLFGCLLGLTHKNFRFFTLGPGFSNLMVIFWQ